MDSARCKICDSQSLTVFAHTARCGNCGVLLYFPYPEESALSADSAAQAGWSPEHVLQWYSKSSFFNHRNFTNMLRFTMEEADKGHKLDILDYGGGGGQFALVCKSHFPEATVFITDISDQALLEEWRPFNIQIPFADFDEDRTRFDFIFLNDVFEHVSDPRSVLKLLATKLKPGGKVFIDTPKQFWIYPLARAVSRPLYTKVLRGTVSTAHLQIWSRPAFERVVHESGLVISKYEETSEYTMPASYYLKNMRITNPLILLAGGLFYRNAKWLAKNKILCVLAAAPEAFRGASSDGSTVAV